MVMNYYVAPGSALYTHPFALAVEKKYGVRFMKGLMPGIHHLVRGIGMYVQYKMTGQAMPLVAFNFKCSQVNCLRSIKRMDGYIQSGDTDAVRMYNDMIDLFIKQQYETTINSRRNGAGNNNSR